MKKLLFILLLLPSISLGQEVTTNNQLPQQFFNNNQPHNEWTCTDPTHNHGNNIGAMVNGDHMMHPGVSLADDVGMSEVQIQNGWESELGADIWHWNTATSTTTMTQTITDNLGNVTTQTRQVILNSCGRTNCGSYGTYTDTHVQGANTATDFQIAVRFDFAESSNRPYHWAVDIKNPTLKITYEDSPQPQISQETLTQLENVDTQIETAIDMLENEEIGGTTFTEMVEDIIIDSGLDMELTMGFVEPEMNMEEQFYIDDAVEIDTLEQNINDEMAGVFVLAPTDMDFDEPEMETPTVEMSVDMEMPDMEMPEPTFTEMAEDTFTNAIDTLSEMLGMDMPTDMPEEVATQILDEMVEMDLPMDMPMEMPEGAPDMEEVYEVPDTMVEEDMPEMEDAPVETVAMNDEPSMETPEPDSSMEMERPEPEPTMEEDTPVVEETTEEPTPREEPTTEEAPVEETPTEDTSTTNDTPIESAEETTVAEADTDTSVSTSSVDTTVETDVKNISTKIEKIIAKVNSKLKRVADKVRASQLVTLKGMQIDGPKLSNYTERTFYKDREMFGGNLDLFDDINILTQQPIYANADLGYQKDDPLNIQRKVLNEINYEKNKIYLELKELRGN
tara:strand:+ start:160 stop:2016 length:1857 start_codon:yes stop_codon:yes gene_type:complete